MKKTKKSLLLMLTLATSVALFAACGGGGGDDSSSGVGNSGSAGVSTPDGGDSSEDGGVTPPDIGDIEIPDVDGAPVANAEEWNTVFQNTLSATNATIITTASEDGVLKEDGIIMFANGVTYETWNNMDGSSSHYFYGEVNGQSYRWNSEDGKTWTHVKTDWTPEDYATVAYELDGFDRMITFENATWNAATGTYTGESEMGAFSVKIADGKVVYLSFYMESAMMPGVDVVYQIVYGQTAAMQLPPLQDDSGVELPDIGDIEIPDVDGEQVADVTAWNAAWANTNAADNITIVATQTFEGETEICYGMMADGKGYMVYADAKGVYGYEYRGVVDGTNYVWASEDGETWEVEEFYDDIERYTTGVAFVRGLDQMADYSAASFENGYYSFSVQGMDFKVKIAGGYVVELHFSDGEESMAYYMEYGNASVELPPLPQEEEIIGEEIKSADDWADVIENTLAQTNYTYTAKGRADRGDGSISILTEYTAVDNDKVYVESVTKVHSGNGSALGNGTRYYQGYVNGVAYEWREMGKDDYYVQQIERVDDVNVVTLFGLDDLNFATASFDEETGAYVFSDNGAIIKVKVVASLICVMEMEVGAMSVRYVYTYGDASVELPPLTDNEGGDNGGNGGTNNTEKPTQDDWDMAFERTLGSKNYSLKMVQSVQYYDGSMALENGFFAKITENAVEQEQYQEKTVDYVTTKTQRREVWANEDGENTHYDFSYENSIWTKSDGTSVSVDRLHQQMASLFVTFADMYDVMEWNDEGYFYAEEYTLINADGSKGNTLYNVYIVMEAGYVMGISYEMKYETYGGILELYFSDYEATKVVIPTDGQGDSGSDNENVGGGGFVENDKVTVNGTVNFN